MIVHYDTKTQNVSGHVFNDFNWRQIEISKMSSAILIYSKWWIIYIEMNDHNNTIKIWFASYYDSPFNVLQTTIFIFSSIIHTYLHHSFPCVNRSTKKVKTNHDKKHSRKSRGFHSFIFSNIFRRISFVIDELKILYLHLRSMWTMGNVRERFFHRILKNLWFMSSLRNMPTTWLAQTSRRWLPLIFSCNN